MTHIFLIQNTNDPELYWDDEYGWTDIRNATVFWSYREKDMYFLPENGKWIEKSESDPFFNDMLYAEIESWNIL